MTEPQHPLFQLFHEVVSGCYKQQAGIPDKSLSIYVAQLLTDFSAADKLYSIRDSSGRPLKDLGEMLNASDPVFGSAYSFVREREVRKHIGDYALFLAGLFPESAQRHHSIGPNGALDLVKTGKESYYIVSQFNIFEFEEEAPLFTKLSDQFEDCIHGLNLVREELERRKILIAPMEPPEQKLLM